MRRFDSSAAFAAAVGQTLGPTDWLTVDQALIDRFADVTGDHQWIHVDVERAGREAPGHTTIAHGYLVLSLIGALLPQLYHVDARLILNYGIDKLRFLAPVPAGARIRLSATIIAAVPASGGYKVVIGLTFALEHSDRPAIVADIVFLSFD